MHLTRTYIWCHGKQHFKRYETNIYRLNVEKQQQSNKMKKKTNDDNAKENAQTKDKGHFNFLCAAATTTWLSTWNPDEKKKQQLHFTHDLSNEWGT